MSCQALFHNLFFLVAVEINSIFFLPEERLLQVNFELKSLGHYFVHLDDMLEDGPAANIRQNLLLHLYRETLLYFVQLAQLVLFEKRLDELYEHFERAQRQVPLHVVF